MNVRDLSIALLDVALSEEVWISLPGAGEVPIARVEISRPAGGVQGAILIPEHSTTKRGSAS